MAWFLNHYICERCHRRWSDEWSCMCDDDCPHCGARHMSPYDSENLTTIVVPKNNTFVVLLASGKAEHDPVYQPVAQFATHAEAEALKDALAS